MINYKVPLNFLFGLFTVGRLGKTIGLHICRLNRFSHIKLSHVDEKYLEIIFQLSHVDEKYVEIIFQLSHVDEKNVEIIFPPTFSCWWIY